MVGFASGKLEGLDVNGQMPSFHVEPSPDGTIVEGWSPWPLPYTSRIPEHAEYRLALTNAIGRLTRAERLKATYTAEVFDDRSDLENLLFYNLRMGFKDVGRSYLRFALRHSCAPASPVLLGGHGSLCHVRYEVAPEGDPGLVGRKLAEAEFDRCAAPDLRKVAVIWSRLKSHIRIESNGLSEGRRARLRIVIYAPQGVRVSLPVVAKPLIDGFFSALHPHTGDQIDEIARRIAQRLGEDDQLVRAKLLDTSRTLLRPKAVPHLRGLGVQWSPDDHLLEEVELVRAESARVRVEFSLMA